MECFTALLALGLAVCIALILDLRRRMDGVQRQVQNLAARAHPEALSGAPPAPTPPPPRAVPAPIAAPEETPVAEPASAALVVDPPVESAEPAPEPPPMEAPPDEPVPVGDVRPFAPPPADAEPEAPVVGRGIGAPKIDIEALIGGRLFLIAGVVTVLFGLAFFLKYAFDRELIGPGGRIGVGVVAGLVALIGGNVLHGRGQNLFGQGAMGLGLGALYLSNYFAAARYAFIGNEVAFGVTALLTATAATLAITKRGPVLAWLGFLGGFAAPALLSTGKDSLEMLAAWLVLLDLGLLAMTWKRRWHGLDLMALAATVVYYTMWHDKYFAAPRLTHAALVVAVRMMSLLMLVLLPPVMTGRKVASTGLVTALFAGMFGVIAGHVLLYPAHRFALAGGIVALAVIYAGTAWMRETHPAATEREGSPLYALALAALATVVPVVFDGRPITPAWSFAGAAIVYAGSLRGRLVLLIGGFGMIALGAGSLLFELPPHRAAFAPFVNGGFFVFASPAIALAAAGYALIRAQETHAQAGRAVIVLAAWLGVVLIPMELLYHFDISQAAYGEMAREMGFGVSTLAMAVYAGALGWCGSSERAAWRVLPAFPLLAAVCMGILMIGVAHDSPFTPGMNVVALGGVGVTAAAFFVAARSRPPLRSVAFVAGALFLLGLITGELISHGEEQALAGGTREDARHRAQVAVSIAWAIYAAASLTLGFMRQKAPLRWLGLSVFILTLLKVFLVDLAALEAIYRIGSFMVLGVLLVAASYLYLRLQGKDGTPPGDEGESGPT